MNYIDQFVDAIKFLTKFNKDFKRTDPDFDEMKNTLISFKSMRDDEQYRGTRDMIENLATFYANQADQARLINQCHSISHGFRETYCSHPISEAFALQVTVGNIFYKGESIYNLSKSKLKNIINQGHQLEESLDVHVWTTFEDMTVFDLTIIPTLVHRGILPKSALEKNPVLVWHDEMKSDFSYQPLLVDNEFMHRVDQVIAKDLL